MTTLEGLRSMTPVRRTVLVIAPVLVLVALGLSLSDRVPVLLEDFAKQIQIDGYVRDGLLGYSPWTIGHMFMWSLVAWVLVVSIGRRDRVFAAAVAVFGLSLLLEGMQVVFTSNRAFQASDVGANLVGCVLGAIVAVFTLSAVEHHQERRVLA